MSTVVLTKWGNSVGIRIPSALVKEAHLTQGETLTITVNKKGGFTLTPIKNLQEGWAEQFNAIADAQQEELLSDLKNDFDEEEWTW